MFGVRSLELAFVHIIFDSHILFELAVWTTEILEVDVEDGEETNEDLFDVPHVFAALVAFIIVAYEVENQFCVALVARPGISFQSFERNFTVDVVIEGSKSQSDHVLGSDHEDSVLQETVPVILLHVARVE